MQFSGPGDDAAVHSPAAVGSGRTGFGGYSEGETPLPIPNRAVKPLSADGTWPARARESRSPPFISFSGSPVRRPVFLCPVRGHAQPITVTALMVKATKEASGKVAVTDPSRVASQPELAEALGVIHLLAEESGPGARAPTPRGTRPIASPRGCAIGASIRRSRSSAAIRPSPRRTPRCSQPRSPEDCFSAPAAAGPGVPVTCSPLSSLVTAALEADLRYTPLSDMLARRPSVNVRGHVPAAGPTRRRVCLCGHLDTTRSGLMFHPARGAASRSPPSGPGGLGTGACGRAPAAAGSRRPRAPRRRRSPGSPLRSRCCSSASCAGRTSRAPATTPQGRRSRCSSRPSAPPRRSSTREVDVLITGCEESGLLGAQAYARRHRAAGRRDDVPQLRHRRRRRAADLHPAGGQPEPSHGRRRGPV